MCRLALFNRQFAMDIGKEGIKTMFTELENSLGGHGMGIGLVYQNNASEVIKSVKMTPSLASELVFKAMPKKYGLEYVIFHTRLATHGSIRDGNCHPFRSRDGDILLAHNGSIYDLRNSYYDISDSAIVHALLVTYGLPLENLRSFGGVYVGTYNNVPYVVKDTYGDLELAVGTDCSSWCLASQLYHRMDKFKPYLDKFAVLSVPSICYSSRDMTALFTECCKKEDEWKSKSYATSYRNNSGWDYDEKAHRWTPTEDTGTHSTVNGHIVKNSPPDASSLVWNGKKYELAQGTLTPTEQPKKVWIDGELVDVEVTLND